MHSPLRSTVVFGAVLSLVASVAVLRPASGAAPLSFHSPVEMPGSESGSEPSIAIGPRGERYISWQAPAEFASSRDGIHYKNLGVPLADGGGDVTNAVDAAGALYNGQICGGTFRLHTCISRSLDGGKTWSQKSQFDDMHPGAADRPWIEVYPHHTRTRWNPARTRVYLEYHTFTPEELAYVTVSTDGGKTFSVPKMITTDTNALNGSGCNTVPGGVVVDDRNGAVYALWLSGNDVVSNVATGCNYSQIGPFNKAWVSVSRDGGDTWTSHLAWSGQFDPITKVGDNADKIFATIAVDRAGQVHVMLPVRHHDDPVTFTLNCQAGQGCEEDPQPTELLLVTSPDGGSHWTAPFKVNSGSGSHFFPWIAAGSRGIIDAIYLHTASLRPNATSDVWYVEFSQIRGAVARVAAGRTVFVTRPVVLTTLLDPKPMHKGGICTFGLFCAAVRDANRRLLDSIAIAINQAGGAEAVWTNDAGEDRVIHAACQSGGPSAYADLPAIRGCYRG